MIQNFNPGIKIFPAQKNSYLNLFNTIKNSVEWDNSIKARKTASYGIPYNYSNLNYNYSEFPIYLSTICSDLENLIGYRPNNCLINFYDKNDSFMGYHSDRIDILYPSTGITILSLGHSRTMRFRNLHSGETQDALMEPFWFLHMSAELQKDWQHSILPINGSIQNFERISVTFRKLIEF